MSRQDVTCNDELPRDAELSRLYRQSSRAEPPARLDRRILDAARQQLEGSEPRGQRRWWRGWLVPVSVFATVVVTSTLTLLVHEERGREEAKALSAPPPAPSLPEPIRQTSPATSAPPVLPSTGSDSSSELGGASPATAGRPEKREQDRSRTRSNAPAQDTPSTHETNSGRGQQRLPAAEGPLDRRRDETKPPVSQRPVAPEGLPESAKEESTPPRTPTASEGQVWRDAERQELRKASPAGPEPPASAAPAENSRSQVPESALRDKVKPVVPAGAPETTKQGAPRPEPSGKLGQRLRSPEAWIEEIRALKRQGREREALEALEQLRRAFPDFALPEDLR